MPTANFSGPAGMVVAGSARDHVFVANSGVDALQVIKVAPGLQNTDLVPAPNRYYPLYIPVGPSPTELAATFDGRFVLVLDAVTGSLQLVDADALSVVRDAFGQPLMLPLGPPSGQPVAIVGASTACQDRAGPGTCLGRFYVAMRALGLIGIVDVKQGATGALSINFVDWVSVGGQPLRLAVHPNADVLFATDAILPLVRRIDLRTSPPTVDAIDVGGVGGPLAVSADGTMLVVGRPDLRDVVILSNELRNGLDGVLSSVDANPVYAPTPRCLADCSGDALARCNGAHPADVAVCSTEQGIAQTPDTPPYGAVWLGVIPSQITAVADDFGRPVTGGCGITNQAPPTYGSGVAVAAMEGSIFFVALRDAAGHIAPQLVPLDACSTPGLTNPGNVPPPSVYLQGCPQFPERDRFSCINDSSGQPVATLLRGQANAPVTFRLNWEGVLPGLDRTQGGGTISPQGYLGDLGTPIVGVQEGDVVQVTTARIQGRPECQAYASCLESRVTAIETIEGQPWLVLDPPLPAACFTNDNAISYRIRAGRQFLVSAVDANGNPLSGVSRTKLGSIYGLGSTTGLPWIMFQPRSDLQIADTNGCNVYDPVTGALQAGAAQSPVLNRQTQYVFTLAVPANPAVGDPYAPARKGLQFNQANAITGTLGKIPGGMAVTPSSASQGPLLLVSFVGADLVFVSNALTPAAIFNDNVSNWTLQ